MMPTHMHWTHIIHLILFAGFFGPLSGSLADSWSEKSNFPEVIVQDLKPTSGPPQNIPVLPIVDILANPDTYHEQIILVRGTVTRLELHVDESTLFIDYVFWLKDGKHRLLVFGQHDRTTGDIQMVTDERVEVLGLFWRERFVDGYRLENNLEAQQVRFFPPVNADRA